MTLGVAILGSTGSVGTQALDVVRGHRDRYRVVALAAGRNTDLLAAQAAEFGVPADCARSCLDEPELLAELAAHPDADVVLNAVVGFAGLPATIAALEQGKRLALANKESLIAGGPVVNAVRARGGGEIVPVDSEHSALYQALRSGARDEVRRLLLTASGGPFRGKTRAELALVTVADALKHPTWDMGAKITIDSSTLMNKGLEVIEAHELFGVDYDHHRRRRPPAVGHPRDGRVQRRRHDRPALDARHATADRPGPGCPRPARRALRGDRLVGAVAAHVRGARPGGLPLPAPRLRGRSGRRRGPGDAQRGQRGGRRSLPGGPDTVAGDRRGQRLGPRTRGWERRRSCRRSGGRPCGARDAPG